MSNNVYNGRGSKRKVLNIELNVNRKTKGIEFNLHYKKADTNLPFKKKHKENIKNES